MDHRCSCIFLCFPSETLLTQIPIWKILWPTGGTQALDSQKIVSVKIIISYKLKVKHENPGWDNLAQNSLGFEKNFSNHIFLFFSILKKKIQGCTSKGNIKVDIFSNLAPSHCGRVRTHPMCYTHL